MSWMADAVIAECLGDAEGMYKPGNWTKQTGPYSC